MAKQRVREKPDKRPAVPVGSDSESESQDGSGGTRASLPLHRQEVQAITGILLAGLLVRLLFLPATGHETDIGTFESWTLSLIKYGIRGFYAHAGFVDYPPGYIFVLALFGWIYHFFAGLHLPFDLLKFAVKAPAIIADLGLAYLSFLLVRRTWSASAALWVAAIVAFNPAVWFLSAYWGQGDSVTAVFLVWAIYFMVTKRFELAWLMFGFAVLIKPQPIVVAPLLIIWQLRTSRAWWRLAFVPVIGFAVAYVGSVFFGPTGDPVSLMSWLYDRYHTGTALYPYNSCNAFNLYSTRLDFWQPDSKLIPNLPGFAGWPQWAWGVAIVSALVLAVVLREWRTTGPEYTRAERESNFYMALFVAMLGFFMFATRMHERYMFSALAIGPLIWNVSRLSRLVYVILSATFLVNLWYALQYLYNPQADLYPLIVHPLSLLNVLCLFLIAGAYLVPELGDNVDNMLGRLAVMIKGSELKLRPGPLAWEGLIGMTRVDVLVVGGLMAVTAVLLYTNIGTPRERIFDEIYYARAAQEYIHHLPQFEWTHPPLTKLLLTIGALLYKVDPIGARLMSALFGTLTVPLLYAFAKRLFSSTRAAVVAVLFLLTSGYFYVQARIATPEIFVAFFALATIYCMYRFWLAAQSVKGKNKLIYADGSQIKDGCVVFPMGERIPLKNATLTWNDERTRWTQEGVTIETPERKINWRNDATITGTIGATAVRDSQPWAFWLVMTSLAVACVIASKWNGLFDLMGIWLVALAVTLQRRLPWTPEVSPSTPQAQPKRFIWGNAYGFRLPLFVAVSIACVLVVYLLTYIPFFQIGNSILSLQHDFKGLLGLQNQMWHYHHDLKATHPYASAWWTWPFELRPVSYYYHVFSGTQAPNQIVAEVIALPNPIMWLVGVFTVPLAALLAWRERHKGMMLCVAAFLFQWLPWIASTRIDFQYNFYPNCAIICLCSTYVALKVWQAAAEMSSTRLIRAAVVAYLVACLLSFIFFLPILDGQKITWNQWDARIWYKDGVPHPYGWI